MEKYHLKLAAGWIRGHAINTGIPELPKDLTEMPLEVLTDGELAEILWRGEAEGLKLYPFKAAKDILPRVRRVLGFLQSVEFDSLLDVGSGRGVFLLPFLEAFPKVKVTSVDLLEHRVTFLQELALGGYERLAACRADICNDPFRENAVDVVTMLEVLEHIPQAEKAVAAAVKTARQYVVVSVPSKEDDNPEHIHLLTKDKLTALFQEAGCTRLHFDGVNGHLILIAAV